MQITLNLSEYHAILAGMQRDVRQAFLALFKAPANTYPEISYDKTTPQNFYLVEIETRTTKVSVDLTIPFKVERAGERVVNSSNAVISVTVERRDALLDTWRRDKDVGEKGIWIVKAASFDQEGVDAVSQTLVSFISALFTPELTEA